MKLETNHIIFLLYNQVNDGLCKMTDVVGRVIVHLCTCENSLKETVSVLFFPPLNYSGNGSAQVLTLLCIIPMKCYRNESL